MLLTLVRHAKSDWSDPSRTDYDRALNRRGQNDCPRMAHWLQSNRVRPELCLISGARRTRETATVLLRAMSVDPGGADLKDAPTLIFDDRLYHAGAETLLSVLRETREDCAWVMLIGHNPGLTLLANRLTPAPVHADLPTLAVATFDLPLRRWRDLTTGQGRLQSLMTPKRLPDVNSNS